MKHPLSLVLICISFVSVSAQSKWSLQNSLGVANETNLGDIGLRISSKVNRQFGERWTAFAQVGAFQMLQSNEQWTGDNAYQEMRALSTLNLDLGGGFSLVNKKKVYLGLNAGGAYRIGRQLWPEFTETKNGHRDIYYTHEKISELGYMLGLDLRIKASERVWLGLDAHGHSYSYFGEYLGVGLSATFEL